MADQVHYQSDQQQKGAELSGERDRERKSLTFMGIVPIISLVCCFHIC